MKLKVTVVSVCWGLLISGCSSDYQPPETADGEQIFLAACAECHTAESDKPVNMFFTLDQANANQQYIAERIANGGLIMPKFPNIKGQQLDQLTSYVLEHSLRK